EGYWRFEENTGSFAYDLSGNGNHAAISGAAWATDAAVYYPFITLNTTAGTHTNTAPIPFTARITRSVTGFTSDDITITNGADGATATWSASTQAKTSRRARTRPHD
ncbi:MAG: hypothetical protein VCB43_04820, partial [Myxococcota bacterium]